MFVSMFFRILRLLIDTSRRHLFIDQLALQPCNPTFLQARDAWIQADVNRFDGANACLLWNVRFTFLQLPRNSCLTHTDVCDGFQAFAGRGLGVNAANHENDATVPEGC